MNDKESLIGKEFGMFVVKAYNPEKSNSYKRDMYDCECKECGLINHLSRADLLYNDRKCKCVTYKEGVKLRHERYKENINKYIGYKTNENSEIISYNEEESLAIKKSVYNLKCGICGRIYHAPLFRINQGKYQICSECSKNKDRTGVNANHFKDRSEEVIGNLKIVSFDHTARTKSGKGSITYWNCVDMVTNEEIVKTDDQLAYLKKKLSSVIKVPFTIIEPTDNKE